MTISDRRQQPLGGNTSTGLLKILALIFMFCDHAGKMCFSSIPELRVIGRLAFPLYCWCMVVGACRTRSMPRYMLRLALVGLISQPLYMVALNHPWNTPNIFLTLLVGLCGVWGMQERRFGSQFWAPVLALAAAIHLNCDAASYGWKGVLLIMLLYMARGSSQSIAAVMLPFCMFWGDNVRPVSSFFDIQFKPLTSTTNKYYEIFTALLRKQAMAIFSLPLIIWPDEIRISVPAFLRRNQNIPDQLTIPTRMPALRMPAWLSYSIYPAHLALLILMQYLMDKPVRWYRLENAWQQFIALF